jgi:hypothetical protein
MKKMLLLFALLLDFFFKSELQASSLKIYGELLYLMPSIEQSYYVISSSNNVFGEDIHPNGPRYNNQTSYHPSFRIGGIYGYNGLNFLDVSFTYFNGRDSDSVSGAFLFDTVGFPGNGSQAPEDTSYAGTASAQQDFTYYALDFTLCRLVFDCCPDGLTFQAGLHYANLSVDEEFVSIGTSIDDGEEVPVFNSTNRESRFWGLGPEIGFYYFYAMPFRISAEISSKAALLCSRIKSRFFYTTLRTGPNGVDLHNDPLWRVIPYIDARLGLNYNFCIGRRQATVHLGYEFIWYCNSVDAIIGYDVAFAGDSFDAYSNFSLHGPYGRLAICF